VGVTFERESQRVYRSLSVPEMGWSLYRLLKLGVGPDGKTPVWRWTVPTPEKGRSVVVGFELEADPWAPLVPRMPRTSGPAGSL
jgi:hypothetical protein